MVLECIFIAMMEIGFTDNFINLKEGKFAHNKRMQPDRSTRYASETAADARRYV
jgi:dolichyl-phosphate-mannose--protein O-mannosyl transferase